MNGILLKPLQKEALIAKLSEYLPKKQDELSFLVVDDVAVNVVFAKCLLEKIKPNCKVVSASDGEFAVQEANNVFSI